MSLLSASANSTLSAWLNLGSQPIGELLFAGIIIIAAVVIFIAVLMINRSVQTIYRFTLPEEWQADKAKKEERKITAKASRKIYWNNVFGLHKLEDEKELKIEEHEYDGISELNNPIPIWFNALFYSTVLFGIGYFTNYHVFGIGMNQDQEYVSEIAKAEDEKKAYLAQAANLIDENTIELDASGTLASSGKAIFTTNCVACHGANGEGGIGPNLTDKYWIHGGDIKDVFRTVKYGVPDKGMVPWEQTLTPGQIAEVSNYIMSIAGTNPANPKAPEGEEYITETASSEEGAEPAQE